MKANAPEKIYLHPDIGGREFIRPWLKTRASQESVEYTRTDFFIEKACEFIEQNVTGYIDVTHKGGDENVTLQSEFVNDFKEFMKEE